MRKVYSCKAKSICEACQKLLMFFFKEIFVKCSLGGQWHMVLLGRYLLLNILYLMCITLLMMTNTCTSALKSYKGN